MMMLARDAFSRGPDLCFLVVKFDPLVRKDMLAWTGLVMCDHFFPGHIALENIILLKFTKRYIICNTIYTIKHSIFHLNAWAL